MGQDGHYLPRRGARRLTQPTIGDELLRLLESAEEEVLLVAPFMKVGAAVRVFNTLARPVSVRCYTRWRPEEVAAGVSDLQIADLVEQHQSAALFLVADLHGKLYCSETMCLVTSANLTDAALGWRSPANLEFAVLLPRNDPSIVAFEVILENLAVAATAEVRAAVEAAAAGLSDRIAWRPSLSFPADTSRKTVGLSSWTPSCLVPSRLYELYQGWDVDVSREAAADGFRDLEILALPYGLSEEAFDNSIRSLLLQHPKLSMVIDKATEKPVSSEAVERFFEDVLGSEVETTAEAFRISAYWIAYFFWESFEIRLEEGREVLSRVT